VRVPLAALTPAHVVVLPSCHVSPTATPPAHSPQSSATATATAASLLLSSRNNKLHSWDINHSSTRPLHSTTLHSIMRHSMLMNNSWLQATWSWLKVRPGLMKVLRTYLLARLLRKHLPHYSYRYYDGLSLVFRGQDIGAPSQHNPLPHHSNAEYLLAICDVRVFAFDWGSFMRKPLSKCSSRSIDW